MPDSGNDQGYDIDGFITIRHLVHSPKVAALSCHGHTNTLLVLIKIGRFQFQPLAVTPFSEATFKVKEYINSKLVLFRTNKKILLIIFRPFQCQGPYSSSFPPTFIEIYPIAFWKYTLFKANFDTPADSAVIHKKCSGVNPYQPPSLLDLGGYKFIWSDFSTSLDAARRTAQNVRQLILQGNKVGINNNILKEFRLRRKFRHQLSYYCYVVFRQLVAVCVV